MERTGRRTSTPATRSPLPWRRRADGIATLTAWHRRNGVPGKARGPARASAATRSGVPGNWLSGGRRSRTSRISRRWCWTSGRGNRRIPRCGTWPMPWPAGRSPRPGGASPIERILAAARALTWPSRLVDLETQACQIVGDEFYERLNSRLTGLHPPQWLRALAEQTGAALQASVAARHRRLAAAVGAAVRAGADRTARRHRERDREAGPRALPRHQGSLPDRAGRSGQGRQAAGRPRAGFRHRAPG